MSYTINNTLNFVKVANTIGPKTSAYQKNSTRVYLATDGTLRITPYPDSFLEEIVIASVADVTAITDNGLVIAVPGTLALLFDLLAPYFITRDNALPSTGGIVVVADPSPRVLTVADHLSTLVWGGAAAAKILECPASLPVGFRCWVVKKWSGNTLTISGTGGASIESADNILNAQYERAEILKESLTVFGVYQ